MTHRTHSGPPLLPASSSSAQYLRAARSRRSDAATQVAAARLRARGARSRAKRVGDQAGRAQNLHASLLLHLPDCRRTCATCAANSLPSPLIAYSMRSFVHAKTRIDAFSRCLFPPLHYRSCHTKGTQGSRTRRDAACGVGAVCRWQQTDIPVGATATLATPPEAALAAQALAIHVSFTRDSRRSPRREQVHIGHTPPARPDIIPGRADPVLCTGS
jgi:hypothetical protein